MGRAGVLTALAIASVWATGCATAAQAAAQRIKPGLANATALPGSVTIDVHDVIANGDDSCPSRASFPGPDPLWDRYPPCPEHESGRQNPSDVSVPPKQPGGSPFQTVHLNRLPSCRGGPERTNAFGLALCVER
jgi:hypothetical protein